MARLGTLTARVRVEREITRVGAKCCVDVGLNVVLTFGVYLGKKRKKFC